MVIPSEMPHGMWKGLFLQGNTLSFNIFVVLGRGMYSDSDHEEDRGSGHGTLG